MSTRKKVIIRVVYLIVIFSVIWIFWYWHNLLVIQRSTRTSNLSGDALVFLSGLNKKTSESLEQFLFQPLPQKRILFVGDIMLGRGVSELMAQNGVDYPFRKINSFLHQADFCVGNLEGPIVEKVPKLSSKSMVFAFSTSSAKALSSANFGVLSLANNHTFNMRKEGLEETRKFLKQENILSFGDPLDCSPNFTVQKGGIIFSGFNKISSHPCPDKEIIQAIKSLREDNPDKFLVVVMHWGKEYSTTSTPTQKQLAHQLIDAGADLIIGSHPHVVEEIESYKGRIIFYSLGNFIFDQYFSNDVQEELSVEAIFYPHMVLYRLLPIRSTSSQPFLMEESDSKIFLKNLSERSSGDLTNQIQEGIIKMSPKSQ